MIFLILEDAEKTFPKLRDRFVRAKREVKKKFRSDTSSASVDKLNETLESLRYLAWPDNYAKPRSARSDTRDMSGEDNEKTIYGEINLNFTQSDGKSVKDLSSQSVAVTSTRIKSATLQKKQKVERKQSKRPSRHRT